MKIALTFSRIDIHCKEKVHIGSTKTLEEVHAFDVAFLVILLSIVPFAFAGI